MFKWPSIFLFKLTEEIRKKMTTQDDNTEIYPQ